tara:strand:- start:85 stop:207 length:123 start_codon:yes stop_codon:yes gene_type:complete
MFYPRAMLKAIEAPSEDPALAAAAVAELDAFVAEVEAASA